MIPILKQIERAVQPPRRFDPATSEREFQLAIPAVAALTTEVSARVFAAAPNARLSWRPVSLQTYQDVVEGHVDIALHVANMPLPEGVAEKLLPPLPRHVIARRDHPAPETWGVDAWLRWPHVVVGIPGAVRGTVGERIASLGYTRKIGTRVQVHAHIAPVLARTDMLSNQSIFALGDDIERYGLRVLAPPVAMPELAFRFFWNARLASDPAVAWIRKVVFESFDVVVQEADRLVDGSRIVTAGAP